MPDPMQFHLIDDGTLDTVFHCRRCGREERFTYMPDDDPPADADDTPERRYRAFIHICRGHLIEDHHCK